MAGHPFGKHVFFYFPKENRKRFTRSRLDPKSFLITWFRFTEVLVHVSSRNNTIEQVNICLWTSVILSWSPMYANFTFVSNVLMVAMTTVNSVRCTLEDYSPLYYPFGHLTSRTSHVLSRFHSQPGGDVTKVIFPSSDSNTIIFYYFNFHIFFLGCGDLMNTLQATTYNITKSLHIHLNDKDHSVLARSCWQWYHKGSIMKRKKTLLLFGMFGTI